VTASCGPALDAAAAEAVDDEVAELPYGLAPPPKLAFDALLAVLVLFDPPPHPATASATSAVIVIVKGCLKVASTVVVCSRAANARSLLLRRRAAANLPGARPVRALSEPGRWDARASR
jgi:hypothetical protein